MEKNYEIIDGLSVATWKEIEKISQNYPKPIKFATGTQAKIGLLKFYLEPLIPDGKAPIEAMDKGRMLTIAYKIYKESEGIEIKSLSLSVINSIIN